MGAMPSMVVISAPPTSFMAVVQERMASPFWCTVHAPQSDIPQPNFVPVSPATSRRYHSSGMSGSPSNVLSFPFTLRRIICPLQLRPMKYRIDFHILVAEREMWKGLAWYQALGSPWIPPVPSVYPVVDFVFVGAQRPRHIIVCHFRRNFGLRRSAGMDQGTRSRRRTQTYPHRSRSDTGNHRDR